MYKMYYETGYGAYLRGYEYSDNPYLFNTEAYKAWAKGWSDAYNKRSILLVR